jgi:hypothetical protein
MSNNTERDELAGVIADRLSWSSLHWDVHSSDMHRCLADTLIAAGYRKSAAAEGDGVYGPETQAVIARAPEYAFKIIAQQCQDDPPRKDRGKRISVIARTRQGAIHEATRLLGEAQSGWHWSFRVDEAVDARLVREEGSHG